MSKQTEALKLAQDLRALADRFSDGWHEGIKIDALDIELLSNAAEALAEQSAQGCKFCSHPLYAGTKCKNCGREQPAIKQDLTPEQPAPVAEPHKQQPSRSDIEPVAWYDEEYDCAYTAAELDGGNVDGLLPLYTSPPAAQQQEPVAWWIKDPQYEQPYVTDRKQDAEEMMGAAQVRPLVFGDTSPPASKPLTDEQIHKASTQAGMQEHYMGFHSGFIRFARAIEAAHGIKGDA